MSAPTPKKSGTPTAASRASTTTTSNTSTPNPSRSPSRMNRDAGASAAAPNGVARTRSVRGGAPLSARAAARKPATPDSAADQDAKAEMQAKMDELQERLQQAEVAYEGSQKQANVLQVRLDEALKEQGIMDERVHEHLEQINDLENEKKESVRARREMEQIYESERASLTKEKQDWATERESMQSSMQRLKETLAQRELRAGLDDERRPALSRQSSMGRRGGTSPGAEETQFAPSSLHRSDSTDSRQTSMLIHQKDKVIESLRLELAEAQIKLVEMENMGGGRMQELEKQIYDVKIQNARLMEENESFQLLLQDKALNGELLQPLSHSESRPPSRNPDLTSTAGQSLADELESQGEGEGSDETRRLQAEVNSMKDQNKALTLYINNIISRLLQHEQFEQILDKTPDLMAGPNAASRKFLEPDKEKDLPPPPPEKDDQPAGFLQRARSVMGGRPKRPMSQVIQPGSVEPPSRKSDDIVTVNEDPQTAPSVPLARSRSSARGGHRRANSEWTAASVVTSMYRQQPPALSPLSPGLTSPTQRTNSFFAAAPVHGTRIPSNTSVPSIPEKDQPGAAAPPPPPPPPPRDGPDRNSVITPASPPATDSGSIDGVERASLPSSPPRSLTPSESSAGLGGAGGFAGGPGGGSGKPSGSIMVGSRMRPLRLVQEAAEHDEAAKKAGPAGTAAANRGSWFGWMNKGVQPGQALSPPQ